MLHRVMNHLRCSTKCLVHETKHGDSHNSQLKSSLSLRNHHHHHLASNNNAATIKGGDSMSKAVVAQYTADQITGYLSKIQSGGHSQPFGCTIAADESVPILQRPEILAIGNTDSFGARELTLLNPLWIKVYHVGVVIDLDLEPHNKNNTHTAPKTYTKKKYTHYTENTY
ncbi:hypothetical protein MIMGU_mgv11b012556mg [Erythranthe guttata]|uniref:PAS fold-2 domain-containing protein n=1 Tax=Erythranthe guttata TaxID=4155 RepID=A0A022QT61_ERYGU|nr:hypothetical protein MIMGU_mgv11b012556mg [Erythranthe guttata]